MKKKYIILRVILYSLALILIFSLIYFERQQKIEANAKIFNEVSLLGSSEIERLEVFCSGNRKLMSKQEVVTIQTFLKIAEFRTTGGHNISTYEYEFYFKLKNDGIIRLIGSNYQRDNWNKDDLYLEDESIPHFYVDSLRIKGLGKWLLANMPPK